VIKQVYEKLLSNCEWLQNSDHLKHGIEGKNYQRDIEKIINALSENLTFKFNFMK